MNNLLLSDGNETNIRLLSKECQTTVGLAWACIEDIMNQVVSGTLLVRDLRLVLEHRENFLNTATILEGISNGKLIPKTNMPSISPWQVLLKAGNARTVLSV